MRIPTNNHYNVCKTRLKYQSPHASHVVVSVLLVPLTELPRGPHPHTANRQGRAPPKKAPTLTPPDHSRTGPRPLPIARSQAAHVNQNAISTLSSHTQPSFPGLSRGGHPDLTVPSPQPPGCDARPNPGGCGRPRPPTPGHADPSPHCGPASRGTAAAATGLAGQAAHHDAGAAGRHNGAGWCAG